MRFYEEQWVLFRTFEDASAAKGMCLWLQNEQVGARCEGGGVFVLQSLEDRAEWVLSQLPPSVEDLSLLAVGA